MSLVPVVRFEWFLNGSYRGYRTVSKPFYERLIALIKKNPPWLDCVIINPCEVEMENDKC